MSPEKFEKLKERMRSLLKSLTYREGEILKLRYGLKDGYVYSLEETGRKFKMTRERVRQIEGKALRKLQQIQEKTGGEEAKES